MLGEVVEVGYIGSVSENLLYNMMGWNRPIPFEVLSTNPDGEVLIGEETRVKVKMKFQQMSMASKEETKNLADS